MKQKLFYLIKITSTILIICALGLEIWQIYLLLADASLPNQLYPVWWLANIALIAHLIEGLIAAFKANERQHLDGNFITYGIYTFFVGFVGLLELQETLSNLEK